VLLRHAEVAGRLEAGLRVSHGKVTDATPDPDARAISAIEQAMTRGILPPRVALLGAPLGVPPADRPDLYRCATLLRAQIPVALSSDPPFGPLDPWAVIAAATGRRTASGEVAGPGERITFAQALDAYLAPPARPGPRRAGERDDRGGEGTQRLTTRPRAT
jgi:Amidohydrolase family